jgi:hypothetical protein
MHPVLYVIDLYSFSSSSNTILNNPNTTLNNNSLVEEQLQKNPLLSQFRLSPNSCVTEAWERNRRVPTNEYEEKR